ncbi:MAG: hypothetical protein U1A22_09760 [Xanthomonadaceae bacterium]|nr:hypothetical protein [Xanthomonadaceae bacterium]
MKTANAAILLLSALALTGCGDGLSKGSLGHIIDARLQEHHEPVCWSLRDNSVSWPVNVDFGLDSPAREPVLVGAVEAGILDLQNPNSQLPLGQQLLIGNASRNRWAIDLTEKGRKAGAWDREKGLCIGRRRVHEVVRWTEPADDDGVRYTEVTYTWTLQDAPKWVEPSHFAGVEGAVEPVESSMTLVKTSDGWRSPY